ncbi:MAG: peptide chain release factor N(5)-glutamine methyltransferase [Paracoccaceae bacterium]|nr:peptide chain release factor N(5)-glutamine methyltransferase [Paracoccaceae bacterium]MDH5531196.1 peptide chain release factor N(5)-glutamine methyltransferase [Paracoccaceae bacterium]
MTVAEALRSAVMQLKTAGVSNAANDARRLLAHVMDASSEWLLLHADTRLSHAQQCQYEADIVARTAHRPVSQIIGKRMFWGRQFRVTEDTLDPRPETECLIEIALRKPFSRVLDLGTGTGCILLTLLAENPGASGLGTDLSAAAISVAQFNAAALGLDAQAGFAISDWFDRVEGSFDLIVSNPPYITADEMADLAPEVQNWEPHMALSPGGDGLSAYRRIADRVGDFLAPEGRVVMEIGPAQGAAVTGYFRAAGFTQTTVFPDLDGRDRVVVAAH